MTNEISRTLGELVELLAATGHPDKAAWLGERLATIDEPSVQQEVLSVLTGMGGLTDLPLNPASPTHMSAFEAEQLRDRLTDRLYELMSST